MDLRCVLPVYLSLVVTLSQAPEFIGTTEIPLTTDLWNDCNRVLDEDGAEFSSPFFPSPYPNNAFCEFHITAPLGQRIQIYFDHFNLEEGAHCTYDALTVFDIQIHVNNPVNVLCGNRSPFTVTSTGDELSLIFRSDLSVTSSGFKAIVSFVVTEELSPTPEFMGTTGIPLATSVWNDYLATGDCNRLLDEDGAEFSSPYFPSSYPNDASCEFLIRAPLGQRIQIYFDHFNLEAAHNCVYDAVRVFDRQIHLRDPVNVLCGNRSPFTVTSAKNELFLIFRSDSLVTHSGFTAKVSFLGTDELPPTPEFMGTTEIPLATSFWNDYLTVPDYFATGALDCNRFLDEDGAEFSSPYFPSSYPNNAFCEFVIIAPLGQRIQIYFDHFNLEEAANCVYDAVKVFDRQIHLRDPVNVLCGNRSPFRVTSTKNELLLTFRSDSSVTRSGFRAKVSFLGTDELPPSSSSYQYWRNSFDQSQNSEYGATNIPQATEIEYAIIDACYGGWSLYSGSIYCFFEEERTWIEASETCASVTIGGSLLQVDNEDENRFIYNSLKSVEADSIWLGITDEPEEGAWVTDRNNTDAVFTNWLEGEPNNYHNEDCALMYLTSGWYVQPGKWNDFPCCSEFAFVCEYKLF